MRCIITMVICGGLTLPCLFAAAVTAAGPRLICEEPSYNFGEREEGESVEHSFVIKNVGDAPADAKKLKAQCGCAAVKVAQDKLAPGEKTSMTLRMSVGKRRGPFRKSTAITSDDDKQDALTLTFEGTVTSTLSVAPERVELGSVDAGKEVTRSAVVTFTQHTPVKITRVVSDPVDLLASEASALQNGSRYRVTIRLKPVKESTTIHGRVLLYTDSGKHPMIDIPVTGTVVGDLVATPNVIFLTGDPKALVARNVLIRSPKDKPFEIKGIECPSPSVKTEVKPMGPGKYRIEITGLTANPALDGKHLLVKTSVASIPRPSDTATYRTIACRPSQRSHSRGLRANHGFAAGHRLLGPRNWPKPSLRRRLESRSLPRGSPTQKTIPRLAPSAPTLYIVWAAC